MRVSIIVDEKRVTVGGRVAYLHEFDWSPFAEVHAVQANLGKDRAEIEYKTIDPDGDGPLPATRKPNELISGQEFADRFGAIMEAFTAAPHGTVRQREQPSHNRKPDAPSAEVSALEARLAALEASNAELQRMVRAHNEAFQQLDKIAGDGQ